MGILAGVIDRAKAFARVGAGKAGSAASTTAAKAAHQAGDAASKGAAKLNEAADNLPNASDGDQSGPSGSATGSTS